MRSTPRAARLRRALVGFAVPLIVAGTAVGPSGAAIVNAAEPSNMVLVWNENAINVIQGATTATPPGLGHVPPMSPLDLAMVQGAIYDAVNAIDRGHQPYLPGLSAPATASKAAAVAQAAHDVLIGLVPSTPPGVKSRVDDMLAASLALIDPGQARNDGVLIGAQAAAAMLLARANDGRFDNEPFPTSNELGKWRLVPPLNANVLGQFATVTPLTMKSDDQFRTEGPIADLTSAAYAADFNEVKALGAQTGSSRTPAQTMLAGFVFANPIPYMNKGLRDIATAKNLSTTQQALLFVKTSFASADALIACWNDKAHWLAWRPQTAIHEAANDGNPATTADPNWTSLFPTPGYPDQPSGYNCYTQGVWYSARLFFGTDKMDFQLTSPGAPASPTVPVPVPGSTRTYTRFSDVARDTIEGRILTGFHFRTADVAGAWVGKKVAQWVDKHEFEPVD
jgi:hypothetical protein